jgi:hypothetical protein
VRRFRITTPGFDRYDNTLTPVCIDRVRAILAGKRDRKEAVSFLLQELRDSGLGGFPPLTWFEDALRKAGFTVDRVYVKDSVCTRAVYVSLEAPYEERTERP